MMTTGFPSALGLRDDPTPGPHDACRFEVRADDQQVGVGRHAAERAAVMRIAGAGGDRGDMGAVSAARRDIARRAGEGIVG